MRVTSLIFVGLISIGIFAAGVTPKSNELAPAEVSTAAESAVAGPDPLAEPVVEAAMPTPSAEPPDPVASPAAPASADPRGRSRRSRRNRYPAPTFAPDEWQAPAGPVRIALQAGHWRADEAPDELDGLRDGGTHAAGLAEWEVNLAVAQRTATMLEELGYEVDLLPAVVPPDYLAHLFIAIHADGATDTRARGFRIASPSRDYTGRAEEVVTLMREAYGRETGLRQLPDVTRRMRNYYAFNVRRYEHSLDPRTVALILETGFLTSPDDRRVIVDDPDRVARGIVEAVKAFPITARPEGLKKARGSQDGR